MGGIRALYFIAPAGLIGLFSKNEEMTISDAIARAAR
jgi:hypothetical protein